MTRQTLILLSLIASIQLFGQSNALLSKRFSVNEQNTAVEDILKKLESDDLRFTYSPQVFDVKRRVSVNFKQERLSVILQTLFRSPNMEMVVMGSQVLIRKKKAAVEEEPDTTANSLKPAVAVTPTVVASESKGADSLAEKKAVAKDTTETKSDIAPQPEATGGDTAAMPQQTAMLEAYAASSNAIGKAPLAMKADSSDYNLQLIEGLDFPLRKFKTFVQQPVKEVKPQKSQEIRTFSDRRGFRFAASLNVGATPIVDETGIVIGGRFNFKSSPSFGVGFAGSAILSPIITDDVLAADYRISGGYGGFLFEYTAFPRSPVHVNFPLVIGGGGVTYIKNDDINSPVLEPVDTQPVFVAEGGAELEVNIFKFMRIGVGVLYRHTSKGALRYAEADGGDTIFATEDLSGLSGLINIKLGRF